MIFIQTTATNIWLR